MDPRVVKYLNYINYDADNTSQNSGILFALFDLNPIGEEIGVLPKIKSAPVDLANELDFMLTPANHLIWKSYDRAQRNSNLSNRMRIFQSGNNYYLELVDFDDYLQDKDYVWYVEPDLVKNLIQRLVQSGASILDYEFNDI